MQVLAQPIAQRDSKWMAAGQSCSTSLDLFLSKHLATLQVKRSRHELQTLFRMTDRFYNLSAELPFHIRKPDKDFQLSFFTFSLEIGQIVGAIVTATGPANRFSQRSWQRRTWHRLETRPNNAMPIQDAECFGRGIIPQYCPASFGTFVHSTWFRQSKKLIGQFLIFIRI